MKKVFLLSACAATLLMASCIKNKSNDTQVKTTVDEGTVLTQFSSVVVNPNYTDINAKAAIMNSAILTFVATPTDANLSAAQVAWRNTRAAWESCEGFLFGPVEDNNYDPDMDSWPVNKTDLDALLASSNPLQVSDIDALDQTLKGFHAIEYVIFGVGSTRKAADIDAREKLYLTSLSASLYNTTAQLKASWDPTQNNFTAQFTTAGTGSTTFKTRLAAFQALVGSMADICDEVGTSKMQDPLTGNAGKPDSTLDESSFSHNSVADFTNNITGIRNAYLCQYGGASGSVSLSAFVASKNASLDAKLQTQMNAAIASFSTITTTYEKAIYTQQNQVKAVQAAIATLHDTIDNDLNAFILQYVKD